MELHLLDIFSAQLWTLVSAIIIPTIAMIATFVSLLRAKLSHKLVGFFTLVPIYIAVTVIVCGDTGNIISSLIPPLRPYPIIGFLASICFGILCLNSIAVICGTGALKRKGAAFNTAASLICFSGSAFFTYKAFEFARKVTESKSFRNDAGKIDIKDALPRLAESKNIPDVILDSGIEIPVILIFLAFLITYFVSFVFVKSEEEIRHDELERRRRALLSRSAASKRHSARKDEDDDSACNCCAMCEYAEYLKTDPTKMLCNKRGIVASTHVCGKFIYDPLKRRAYRPRIDTLSHSEGFTDDIN